MERKFERNNPSLKKILICALLIAFASSAIASPMTHGREITPAQVPLDNTPATSDENPMLIAPNPQPDNTSTILEIAALVTVITVAIIIVALRRHTKTSA